MKRLVPLIGSIFLCAQLSFAATDPQLGLLKKQPGNETLRIQIAKSYIKTKDFKKAASLLQEAPKALSLEGQVILARAFELDKNYAEQIRILELLIKKEPNSYTGNLKLAEAYFHSKKIVESIGAYKKAIQISPKSKKAYLGLLKLYEDIKNNYETQVVVSDMTSKFPSDPEVLSASCRIHASQGFFENALEFCKSSIDQGSKNPDDHIFYAIALKGTDQAAQGEKIVFNAAKSFENSELVQKTAGEFSDSAKNWENSFRYYETCSKHHETSLPCQLGYAKSAFELNRYDTALKSYTIACNLDFTTRPEFQIAINRLNIEKKEELVKQFLREFEKCGLKSSRSN